MRCKNAGVRNWQSLLVILCLWATPQSILCQSKDDIPVPEYFGIYAVVDGHLIKLDAQQVHADKSVTVRLGQRNGVGNVLQGQPVASSTNAQVPELAGDLKIVVFSQTGGLQTPLDTAKSLHLERLVFVRNLTVNTGFPNNVRRSGAENGWESGDAPELLGMASGDRAKNLEFLIKPMQGHQDMVVAVLPEKLSPGLYRIRVGEANPFSGGGGLVFAVSPVNDGETMNCVDATVTYSFNISNSKYVPCDSKAQTSGTSAPQGTEGPSSSGQPGNSSGTTDSSCGNYDACFSAGLNAYKLSDWQGAITDFQAAENQRPTTGEPWVWLGRIYLRSGPNPQGAVAWDKALALGATLVIGACRERTLQPCERGDLSLSSKSISFLSNGSQAVFAAPPSQITPKGIFNNSQMAHVSFGLKVGGKKYNFDFLPLGVACQIQLFVQCPQQGIDQQLAVANYVSTTIPKLATGAFGQATRPTAVPTPSSSPTGQPTTPTAGCGKATDMGYSLTAGGHPYRVKAIPSSDAGPVHVFFDEKGSPVLQDDTLLKQLALGAWVRENIVASAATRAELGQKDRILSGMIGTSQAIQGYEVAQDVLVRGMTDAIEAYVTPGTSLTTVVRNLTMGVLVSQLMKSPRTIFTLAARNGLQRSRSKYNELVAKKLYPADATALDVDKLQEIKDLYGEAQALELPNEALAAALMPKRAIDLTNQALQSVLSEIMPGLKKINPNEAVTLDALLKLQKSVAEAGKDLPALKSYYEKLNLALHLTQANDRKIDTWAKEAVAGCSQTVLANPGGTTAGAAESMAFGYANPDGSALLSATTAIGDSTSIERPEQFDTAVCSDNAAVTVSFEGYQKSGPRDDGRAWAKDFDQHQGYRFRVVQGRPSPDASCLLTTKTFLSGRRFLPLRKDAKGIPCEPQAVSRLTAVEKRGVYFCRRFATVGADGELLAVEFERRGNDLLAGIVLNMGGQLFVQEVPAKYDPADVTGWRVGDQGHLFNYDQKPSFLDLEVVNVFRPLFALKDEAEGGLELGIQWAGEEGLSLKVLSSSGGKLQEIASGYRYTQPL